MGRLFSRWVGSVNRFVRIYGVYGGFGGRGVVLFVERMYLKSSYFVRGEAGLVLRANALEEAEQAQLPQVIQAWPKGSNLKLADHRL